MASGSGGAQVTVAVNDQGDGTATHSGGTTDTLSSIEAFIAGESLGVDAITINDTGPGFLEGDVTGLDDNAVGTFTPASGPAVNFGPSETQQLSDILALGVPGTVQITSGDEAGTVGGIVFETRRPPKGKFPPLHPLPKPLPGQIAALYQHYLLIMRLYLNK